MWTNISVCVLTAAPDQEVIFMWSVRNSVKKKWKMMMGKWWMCAAVFGWQGCDRDSLLIGLPTSFCTTDFQVWFTRETFGGLKSAPKSRFHTIFCIFFWEFGHRIYHKFKSVLPARSGRYLFGFQGVLDPTGPEGTPIPVQNQRSLNTLMVGGALRVGACLSACS